MDNFKKWLTQKNMSANAISSVCSRIKRIYKNYDIEAEYRKDKCIELLYDFTYTAADADNGILPNVKIQVAGSYVTGLAALKNALKLYVEYLDHIDKQSNANLTATAEVEEAKNKRKKKTNNILSFYVGNFDDFNTYIGPKCRNIIQAITKPMKNKVAVCECCRQKKTLEAAHQKGFERLDVIKRILDNECTIIAPDVYRVDLVDFEKKFIDAHQPYEDKFFFLCKDCHKKYDKGTQMESDQVLAGVLANRKMNTNP